VPGKAFREGDSWAEFWRDDLEFVRWKRLRMHFRQRGHHHLHDLVTEENDLVGRDTERQRMIQMSLERTQEWRTKGDFVDHLKDSGFTPKIVKEKLQVWTKERIGILKTPLHHEQQKQRAIE
jgi:hypothetical protein